MRPVLIAYATREGHTRLIAEHLVSSLRTHGVESVLRDAREPHEAIDPAQLSGAILAASVHMKHHESEMERLIVREREALERLPTLFLSVSMSATTLGDESQPAERRAEVARELAKITDATFAKTGWHPDRTEPVAGALMYTKYNLIVRWVMKRIARAEGASTDVAHDHVYTNWDALDLLVADFVSTLDAPRVARPIASAE